MRYYHQNNVISNSVTHGGVGFCGLLTIAFVVLKLTDMIDWSWWWVTAPLWLPSAVIGTVIMAIAIAFLGAAIIMTLLAKAKRNKST